MGIIQGAVATTEFIDAQHSGDGLLLQVTGNMQIQVDPLALACSACVPFFAWGASGSAGA